MMRLLLSLMLVMPLAWSAPDKGAKEKGQKSRTATESLTGCVDEKGETYVLRDLTAARIVTTLRGKGFSNDNFARYVGHTVTVHGTIQKEGDTSVINVTKVDDAGPGCSGQTR